MAEPLILQISAEDLASAILDKVRANVQGLAPAATQAATGLNTLTTATQKSSASASGFETALKQALYQTGQTSTGAQKLGQSLKGTGEHAITSAKAVEILGGKTAQAHGHFLTSVKSALGFGQGLGTASATGDKLASSLSGVVSGLVLFTGATLGISAGIKLIGDFQQSLANVSTLVDTSKVSLSGFRDQILQLPPALGDSTDLVKGLYQALSAGVAPAQAITLVTSAAKLAQAGLTDTKTSVDVLTTAINAYGLKASDSARLSDQLFETVIIGKTEVKDLASNLGSAIPIAAALGVSFSDLNATVATLTQGGLSTAEAVTAVRSAFTNMIQNAEKFRAVGIDVTKVLAEEGITGLFRRLTTATEGSAEGIRKLIPDAQGLVGALALVGNQSGILADAQKRVAGAVGTTDLAVQKQAQTIPKALSEVGTAFKQLELTLTQEFAEAAVPALHAVRDAVLDVGKFAPTIKQAFAGTTADIVGFVGTSLLAFAQFGEFIDRQADKIGLLSETNRQFTAGGRALAEDLIKQSAEVRAGIALEIEANAKKAASQGQVVQEQQKFIDVSKILVGQVASGAASADLFRTSVTGLAGEFGGLGEKASGASSGVEKLGSTQEQTQSKTGQLLEGVRGLAKELGVGKDQADLFEASIKLVTPPLTEAAKASGITTDELRSMVKTFAELALPAAELQKQLNAIGITEKQLSGETATLTAAQIRAADAQGLSATNALALLSAYQDLSPQLVAQSAVLQKAGVDVARLTQNLATLTKITQNYGATASEIEAAFKRTFGIGVQESARFGTQLAKDMQLVSDAGTATGAATLDAFTKPVEKIIETFGTLPPAVAKEFDRIAEKGAGVSGEVLLAFRELGEKTPQELTRLQDKALIAFETIQRSGVASPREIARFWVEEVVPKILDANGKLPPGLERINDKLVQQAKETGVQVREALIDPYAQLGIKAPAELQHTAEAAINAFDQISAGGEETKKALVRIFVEDVAPQIIDANGKIPTEWRRQTDDMVAQARKLGIALPPVLEDALASGVEKGVGRAKGALNELGQGLAIVGEKFQVVFKQSFAAGSAGLIEQLRKQQAQLADIPDIVRSAFSGGNSTIESRTAYAKQLTTTTLDAIELITGKLKALGFDAQGNPLDKPSPLTNPFDALTTGAKAAAAAIASIDPTVLRQEKTTRSTASLDAERGLSDAKRQLQAEETQRTASVQAESLKLNREFTATQKALQADSLASVRSFADQKKALDADRLASARDFADQLKTLDVDAAAFEKARDALAKTSLASARGFMDQKRALDDESLASSRDFFTQAARLDAAQLAFTQDSDKAKLALAADSLDAARDFADQKKALDADSITSARDFTTQLQQVTTAQEALTQTSARDRVKLEADALASTRSFADQKRALQTESLASARTFTTTLAVLDKDQQTLLESNARAKRDLDADALDSSRDFADRKRDLAEESVRAARGFADQLKALDKVDPSFAREKQRLDAEALASARKYADEKRALDEAAIESARDFTDQIKEQAAAQKRAIEELAAAKRKADAEALASAQKFADQKRALDEAAIESARQFGDDQRQLAEEQKQAAVELAQSKQQLEAESLASVRDFADQKKALDAASVASARDYQDQSIALAEEQKQTSATFAADKLALDAASLESAKAFVDEKRALDEASVESAREFTDQQRVLADEHQADAETAAQAKLDLQAKSLESVRDFADQKLALDADSLDAARSFTDTLQADAQEHTALVAANYDENLALARDYAAELAAIDADILASKRQFQQDLASAGSSGGGGSGTAPGTSTGATVGGTPTPGRSGGSQAATGGGGAAAGLLGALRKPVGGSSSETAAAFLSPARIGGNQNPNAPVIPGSLGSSSTSTRVPAATRPPPQGLGLSGGSGSAPAAALLPSSTRPPALVPGKGLLNPGNATITDRPGATTPVVIPVSVVVTPTVRPSGASTAAPTMSVSASMGSGVAAPNPLFSGSGAKQPFSGPSLPAATIRRAQSFAGGGIVQGTGGIDSELILATPGERISTPSQDAVASISADAWSSLQAANAARLIAETKNQTDAFERGELLNAENTARNTFQREQEAALLAASTAQFAAIGAASDARFAAEAQVQTDAFERGKLLNAENDTRNAAQRQHEAELLAAHQVFFAQQVALNAEQNTFVLNATAARTDALAADAARYQVRDDAARQMAEALQAQRVDDLAAQSDANRLLGETLRARDAAQLADARSHTDYASSFRDAAPVLSPIGFASQRFQSFAGGGIVQGSGGTDSQLIRATPGERIQTPAQQVAQGQAGPTVINITIGEIVVQLPPGTSIISQDIGRIAAEEIAKALTPALNQEIARGQIRMAKAS